MKRKYFYITLLLISMVLSGCYGCSVNKQIEYFKNYMSGISVEIEGYSITKQNNQDGIHITPCNGDFIINNTEINVHDLYVSFNDNKICIDHEFLLKNNKIYKQIYDMWYEYEKTPLENRTYGDGAVKGLFVYDDNLFIYCDGVSYSWTSKADIRWQIPVIVFKYDFLENKLYYVGYYDNVTENEVRPYLYLIKN